MKSETIGNFILGVTIIILNIVTLCEAETTFISIVASLLLLLGIGICLCSFKGLLDAYIEKKINEYLKK